MATVGHIAVGLAAARADRDDGPPRWPATAFWPALSLLPDVDVIGFATGVAYADPWGHRGATHSLAFAAAVGLAIGLAAPRFDRHVIRTGLLATAVLASHALLDTMTDGGLGCALWWPFDLTRYFAPWRPIPVAPIGLGFFSAGGIMIALTELVFFGPALFYALRGRRAAVRPAATAVVLALWAIGVWLVASGDPLREKVVGIALREDTAYAKGYSEAAFRSITPGASDREVRQLLGAPLSETWFYAPKDQPLRRAEEAAAVSIRGECLVLRFESAVVDTALDSEACGQRGIRKGTAPADVERQLGAPRESCWSYTWSPRNKHHRVRMVCFLNGRIDTVVRRWVRY